MVYKGRYFIQYSGLTIITDPPGQPEITGYQRNKAIRTNDTVQFVCTSIGGNPLATVYWYKNDKRVDYSFTTKEYENKVVNELNITAQPSDNKANYTCLAWNLVNTNSPLRAQRTLLVQCKLA